MVSGFSNYCNGFPLLILGEVHLQIWKGDTLFTLKCFHFLILGTQDFNFS